MAVVEPLLTSMIRAVAKYVDEELYIVCHPAVLQLIEHFQLGIPIETDENCPLDNIYVKQKGDSK